MSTHAAVSSSALNAVVDALQISRDQEVVDLLNLAANLTGYLTAHPAELAGFRAGGPEREAVLARALEESYGQIEEWMAELIAPFAPGLAEQAEA